MRSADRLNQAASSATSKALSWSGSKHVKRRLRPSGHQMPKYDGAPEWTAIGVQRQPRLVGLLLQRERNQVTEGALVAMVSPDKTLSGGGIQGGKSFPIPRSRTNGVGKNVTQTGAADVSHQHADTP